MAYLTKQSGYGIKVSGFFLTSRTDKIKTSALTPSKLFADEVGGNLAAGVGVGFAKQMKTWQSR